MFCFCAVGYKSSKGKDQGREVSRVQIAVDNQVYLDSGFFSGLAAMSELRELLDELYENLA
jgi:hypothetical protein